LKNIDILNENLRSYGYDTVTVDNGWFLSSQGKDITSDIWDNKSSLETAFRRWEAMQDYAGLPLGSFLDMDMLCFGRLYVTRNGGRDCKFTQDQKRTFTVQRALAASPLMLGGVLYSMDDFSLNLFKHPEILACNRNAVIGKLMHRHEKIDVWQTPHRDHKNSGWIGIFNRDGKNSATIELAREQLGLKDEQAYILTDNWTGRALPVSNRHTLDIPADGVAFIKYAPARARTTAATAKKPNIIYILVDDLGYGDLGCYGQDIIKTPNIDRLAAQGMRFTDHYSGSTVCAPSRCALMTGKHTGHTTVVNNAETPRDQVPMGDRGAAGQAPLKPGEVTLAHLAKQAGYQTACIGKWGLGSRHSTGDPGKAGFDHFFGYYDQRDAHYFYIDWLWRNGDPVELKDNPRLNNQYSHDLLFNESVQWLKAHKDNPFFLYLSFTIPHAELRVPEASMAQYEGIKERKPWGNIKADYRIEREQWGLYNACKKPHQTFAGMVSHLDRDIGRLMDLLKELNLDQNTLVLFTSDNGPHNEGGADPAFFKSAGVLRGGKRSLHEGGIRVPFIARQPGQIEAGSVSDHASAFWDIMPTLCDLISVDAPQDTDGISLIPTLYQNAPQTKHDYLYWQYAGNQAVRCGPWKLVGNNNAQLYNLETDLSEKTNLASQHPDLVNELKQLYKDAKR
ncbi:MAG: sulfatase-like hydrolase/transferase, partial [Planctomycetes bacterium]|nr:sulfatase-like hydrolase/transferase [Planctomycetota bacterium]